MHMYIYSVCMHSMCTLRQFSLNLYTHVVHLLRTMCRKAFSISISCSRVFVTVWNSWTVALFLKLIHTPDPEEAIFLTMAVGCLLTWK